MLRYQLRNEKYNFEIWSWKKLTFSTIDTLRVHSMFTNTSGVFNNKLNYNIQPTKCVSTLVNMLNVCWSDSYANIFGDTFVIWISNASYSIWVSSYRTNHSATDEGPRTWYPHSLWKMLMSFVRRITTECMLVKIKILMFCIIAMKYYLKSKISAGISMVINTLKNIFMFICI